MAVGDVETYELRMQRKEIALRPGRYLVMAKGYFQQTHPDHGFSATFGFCQLFFGYGNVVQKIDEATAYLGSVGWVNPSDPSSTEGSRGGAVVLQAVVEVDEQTGPNPEPGRLVFQAGATFAGLRGGRMVIIEIKPRVPLVFPFAIPLADVSGLEDPAQVLEEMAKAAGGSAGKG